MSNMSGFLPVWPSSAIERILILDYLLSQGFFFDDLQSLSGPEREQLFARACQFARKAVDKVFPAISLARSFRVDFSKN
jgi:hypothetical protein